jgi:hypothetical protein
LMLNTTRPLFRMLAFGRADERVPRPPTWPGPMAHQCKYLITNDLLSERVGFEPTTAL